jgi:carbonic anhydrase/acetyltransferase-like protein (isoleucine patch superfamily)
MENIVTYKQKKPQIADDAYINPFAVVIGDVKINSGASLWPGVIVRADEESIEIGKNVALLDRALIEAPQGYPVRIEDNVLVSHNVTLHGCIIEKGVLIGIGASVLEGSVIGRESVIGAGSLIPTGMEVPLRSKVLGVPGKVTGTVTDRELKEIKEKHGKIKEKAKNYGSWFVTGKM